MSFYIGSFEEEVQRAEERYLADKDVADYEIKKSSDIPLAEHRFGYFEDINSFVFAMRGSIELVDLKNALCIGKSCPIHHLDTVGRTEDDKIVPLPPLLRDDGITTVRELYNELTKPVNDGAVAEPIDAGPLIYEVEYRKGENPLSPSAKLKVLRVYPKNPQPTYSPVNIEGVRYSVEYRKGVHTFSPFVKVEPIRTPAEWNISHVVRAMLSGQIYRVVITSHSSWTPDTAPLDDIHNAMFNGWKSVEMSDTQIVVLARKIIDNAQKRPRGPYVVSVTTSDGDETELKLSTPWYGSNYTVWHLYFNRNITRKRGVDTKKPVGKHSHYSGRGTLQFILVPE